MRGAIALFVLSVAAAAVVATGSSLENAPLYKFFHNKVDSIEHDGSVTLAELQHFIDMMDPSESEASAKPDLKLVSKILNTYDTNADGVWTWTEFVSHFGRLLANTGAAANGPQEIHLALTADATEMVVNWALPESTSSPEVQWGLSASSLSSSAVASAHNYSVEMIEGPWHSMQLMSATMTALKPSTKYYYKVGDAARNLWSSVLSFTSAPAAGSVPEEITFAVYGDMGTVVPFGYKVTDMLIAENAKKAFEFILHVGDLAYAGVSSDKWGEWEPTWDTWMTQIEPLAQIMPYMTSVGNHENYYNYSSFVNRFQMPTDADQGNGNFWWSVDYGSVHITSFSSENDYAPGSEQYAWLEADLAAARARPSMRWLFLAGHRPFLSSDNDEYNQHCPGAQLITDLSPLLAKYGVDMVFSGHQHMYERMYPTVNGTVIDANPGQHSFVNPSAPVYIMQGNAGAMVLEKLVDPQPAWSAFRLQDYGFGRVTLNSYSNGTDALHYEAMSNGAVVDQMWIFKH